MQSGIRNIGIIAHVDAGKTTLTEQLLFVSGAIRSAGRVDHGTSQTDSMDVERERGISVRAAVTGLNWKETQVRIVDTPGHADFYAEVERSLCVLDGAVLVLSAVEGVQLQTNTIWRALRELGIPTLIFINKLDRVGAAPNTVLEEVRAQLSSSIVPLQEISNVATESVEITATTVDSNIRQSVGEFVAGLDDAVMETYLHDEALSWSVVDESLQRLCGQGAAFPVFFGVAKLGIGIAELLDGIVHYLPAPSGSPDNDLSSIVFKIENEKSGRLTHVRVFEGTIKRGAPIRIGAASTDEKPARILVLTPGGEYQTTDQLVAGDIGVLYGMQKTKVGYVLGDPYASRQIAIPAEPMLTARIQPDNPNQWNDLLQALRQQEDEDPLLNVEWREGQKEINVRFFGEIQMEIIREVLASRYQLPATFSEPGVLYKETPAKSGEAKVELRTTGFADIHIRVDPAPAGSGFQFESLVKADKVYFKFVKQIPQILEQARRGGPRGWEVTDLKVTLLDGLSRYDLGTKPGDFKIVTPQALAKALESTGTSLLEPMMDFEITVPEEFGAQIYRDLMRMRARFDEAIPVRDRLQYKGLVPYAETFEYTASLYASSHGQGVLKTSFYGYLPVAGVQGDKTLS